MVNQPDCEPEIIAPESIKTELAVEGALTRETILDGIQEVLETPIINDETAKDDQRILRALENISVLEGFSKKSSVLKVHPVGQLLISLSEEFAGVEEANLLISDEIGTIFNENLAENDDVSYLISSVEEYFGSLEEYMENYDDFLDSHAKKNADISSQGVVDSVREIEKKRKSLQLHARKVVLELEEFDPSIRDRDSWAIADQYADHNKDEGAAEEFEKQQLSWIGKFTAKVTQLATNAKNYGRKAFSLWKKMQNYRIIQWMVQASAHSTSIWMVGHFVYQVGKQMAIRCTTGCTGMDILFAVAAGGCNSLQDPTTLAWAVERFSDLMYKTPPMTALNFKLLRLGTGVISDTVAFLAPALLNRQVKSFLAFTLRFMCGMVAFAQNVVVHVLGTALGTVNTLFHELKTAPSFQQAYYNWVATFGSNVLSAVQDEGDFVYQTLPANAKEVIDSLGSASRWAAGGGYEATMAFLADPTGSMKSVLVGSATMMTTAVTNQLKSATKWIGLGPTPVRTVKSIAKIRKALKLDPTIVQRWTASAGNAARYTKDTLTPYLNGIYDWFGANISAVGDKFNTMMETFNYYLYIYYWVKAIVGRTRKFFGQSREEKKIAELQQKLADAYASQSLISARSRVHYIIEERKKRARKISGKSRSKAEQMREQIEDEFQELRRAAYKTDQLPLANKFIDMLEWPEKGPAFGEWDTLNPKQQNEVYADIKGTYHLYLKRLTRAA
jgi:hypothetical protein